MNSIAIAPRTIPSNVRADLDSTRWAVVIPSYKHAEDAISCLESLWRADARPSCVLLIDDASPDNAVASISAWATRAGAPQAMIDSDALQSYARSREWLTIVSAQQNSGFSASCNRGLLYVRDHTNAPFVLLLNNDAAVSSSYFTDLASGIAQANKPGLATGTIYEWDRETVWYAGGRFNPLRAVAEHFLTVPADASPRSTDFICGCTMLISREVLETVGLLPECYSPCYCEDADYSLKVKKSGFELVYVPGAKAFHRVSASLGRETRPPQVIYWFNRNRGYAIRRNYGGWSRAAGVTYLAVTKPARALWELFRGRPGNALAFIRGTAAGLFSPIPRD
jgi:GT2 family glycosyltransferase